MVEDASAESNGSHSDRPGSDRYQRWLNNFQLVQSILDPETRDQLKRTEWLFHSLLTVEPSRRADDEELVESFLTDGGPVQVLIVEDEPGLAELYEQWLAETYKVITAMNGEAALAKLDDGVDVVLLDRHLPGCSGDTILAEIRERDLPCRVAMVTGVEPDFDIIEMGFDDYLTKPVSKSDLQDVVERLSRRAKYDEEIREYFALVSTKAALDAEKDLAERSANEEYARLEHELEERRNRFSAILDGMEDTDFDLLLRTFPPTEIPTDGYEPLRRERNSRPCGEPE